MTLCRVFVVLFLLVLAGCTKSLPPEPPLNPVRGKVTQANGQPLPGGVVHLTPKNKTSGCIPAHGFIQNDGSFSIRCYTSKDGAVAGGYLVSLESRTKDPIPDKYLDSGTSEISIDVKKGDNTLDIVLK
jgi:hypothetical protein